MPDTSDTRLPAPSAAERDPSQRSWEDIWTGGLDAEGNQTLTAQDAAHIHGVTADAAYKWAKAQRRAWRRVRRDLGTRIREVHRQRGIAQRELPSNGTTWAKQHAMGRCLTEAAQAMGKTKETGRRWAEYHGKVWPCGHSLPSVKARRGASVRAAFVENPELRARNRAHLREISAAKLAGAAQYRRDPARNRLAALSPEELAQYRLYMRKKFTSDEAMIALGRPELTRARFNPKPAADPVILLRDRMAASARDTAQRLALLQAARAPESTRERRHA